MDPHERFDHKKPHHWKRLILETFGIALCVGTAGLVFYLWDYDHRVAEEINMIESGIPLAPIMNKTTSTSTPSELNSTSTLLSTSTSTDKVTE